MTQKQAIYGITVQVDLARHSLLREGA